jgi:alpha-galactosidase
MSSIRKKILALLSIVVFISNAYSQLAQKPPMGWNSYNCFGSAVQEDEVKANADYVAKNLKPYGWQYIVVDFLWSFDNPPGSKIGNPYQRQLQDGSYVPWLAMDKWGRLLPHANKFPSAFGGNGFKSLSDYVHSLGLKFGIHVMRGIPRQAVWAKSPIKNTNGITADMIADTSSTCSWMNHMYGIDMKKPGAQEYLNSILELYKDWDVDFIKVDDIARPYHLEEVEGYYRAIANTKREIVLSISPGETPRERASHVKAYVNMWRMADDFWDNWKMLLQMFDYAQKWEGVSGYGHWADCDMIQIGKLSKRGPVGPERFSRFTEDELYTHMNFWSIFKSPLMLGGNQPENRELELKLFTNQEVIDVNQIGENPRILFKNDSSMIWISNMTGNSDINVGVFNIGEKTQDITIDFSKIGVKGTSTMGLKGKVLIRDLWKQADIGTFKKSYSVTLNKHASALLRLRINK